MINTKQRAELHKGIWKIANELRGSVDGWDFKSYVLGFLFYRFLCENLKNYVKSMGEDNYESLDDEIAKNGKAEITKAKGFFILPSELFENVLKSAEKSEYLENLNEHLNSVFANIQKSSEDLPTDKAQQNFKGLFDDMDLKSDKLGKSTVERNKKLARIMQAISEINFDYTDSKIDAFGDAYEFLMTMYASSAGKSGGEFFTPQEVSEILARLTLHTVKEPNKVYDPACGSGSLLLQYKKILDKDPALGYFGQEINITSYNLARMNMLLHNVNFTKFSIAHDDTLIKPYHYDDEPFDVIVSNPPYSTKWEGDSNPLLINDPRYSPAGVLAPKSKSDFAFIMHSLAWLSNKGAAAIVIFPGILYREGAEKKIREYLIKQNFIDSIIALPDNLFFGTGIATCIMVLKKNKQDSKVFFIDASKEYKKVTKKNQLTQENRDKIVRLYAERKDIEHTTRAVSMEEIEANGYNLSVSSYIEPEDTREKIDIKALNAEITQIVVRQSKLRLQIDAIIAELEGA